MSFFNLFLANLLQGNAVFIIAKYSWKVEGMTQNIYGKYKNREILFSQLCRRLFTRCWPAIKVISFASGKRIRKAYNGRTKVKLFTKKCLSIPQRFSCRNQWAFKKSDNILCALEVLNVDNLKACVCYFLLNFNFFTKW